MHVGAVPWTARAHAALLHAGPGSALTGEAAAYVWGLRPTPPPVIHVVVPASRRVVRVAGVRVRRARRLQPARRQGYWVTDAADTVLDLAGAPGAGADSAIGVAADAVRLRIATAPELVIRLQARTRHRQRRALRLALGDIDTGLQSVLEVRAQKRVLRAHGLPPMRAQAPDGRLGVRRDFESEEFGVILEVDGQIGHLGSRRLTDYRRDRRAAAQGKVTLRAGWVDVDSEPCALAADLAGAFAARGYRGGILPCGPGCRVGRGAATA